MPATPRWLLAVPDAIRQLETLDRDLLTRRDMERLFGVSRARAAQLMRTFGAELVGASRVLRRTEAPAAAAEVPAAGRVPRRGGTAHAPGGRAPPGAAHRDPGRGAQRETLDGAPGGLPDGVSVEPGTGSRCASAARRTPSGGSSRSPRR